MFGASIGRAEPTALHRVNGTDEKRLLGRAPVQRDGHFQLKLRIVRICVWAYDGSTWEALLLATAYDEMAECGLMSE
jgi:hypothetical protein